jgi:hypothetical protein
MVIFQFANCKRLPGRVSVVDPSRNLLASEASVLAVLIKVPPFGILPSKAWDDHGEAMA